MADRLCGADYRLSVFGIGRSQMPFLAVSVILGGNVRVGLEDSLPIGRGKPASSNAKQLSKIRRVIEELGLSVATSAEARARDAALMPAIDRVFDENLRVYGVRRVWRQLLHEG